MAYCTFSETSFNCFFKTWQPLSWLCCTFNRVNCCLHPWAAFSSVSEVLRCCSCCIEIRRCDISDRGGPKHAPASRHAVGGHLSVSAILRPCSYFILLCLHALSRDIMEVWKKKKKRKGPWCPLTFSAWYHFVSPCWCTLIRLERWPRAGTDSQNTQIQELCNKHCAGLI